MDWNVYLSGEIHTDWREKIKEGTEKLGLPIIYTSAVTDHDSSDAAGDHLGKEDNNFWRDHKSSKVNSIRTKTLIEKKSENIFLISVNENFLLILFKYFLC